MGAAGDGGIFCGLRRSTHDAGVITGGAFAAEKLRMKGEVSEGYLYGKEPAKPAAADLCSNARNNQLFH